MRRIFKILGWIAGVIFFLLILIFILPHIPPVQRKLVNSLSSYYSKKTGQEISLGKIYIWPDGTIVLKDLDMPDDFGNPFIQAGIIRTDISIRRLLKGDFILTLSEVENGNVSIERRPDGTFNFDFLIKAFTGGQAGNQSNGGQFSLQTVFLENTDFRFSDRRTRLYTRAYVKFLQTSFKTFDTRSQIFHMSQIHLVGGDGFLVDLSEGKMTHPASSSEMVDVSFEEVQLYDTRYLVYIKDEGMITRSYAGELKAKVEHFDLERALLEFNSVQMKNSGTLVKQNIFGRKINNADTTRSAGADWIIVVDQFSLENSWFSYKDGLKETVDKGFDPSNFSFSHVDLKGKNLINAGSNIKAVIHSGSLLAGDGYRVNKISGEFYVAEKSLGARSFQLETNSSDLSGDFITRQASLSSFSKNLGSVLFYVNLRPSKIGVRDILYFAPQLDTVPLFADNKYLSAGIGGNAQGTLKKLVLNNFTASLYGSNAAVTGRLMNLDSSSAFAYDVSIHHSTILASSVNRLVPDTVLPDKIHLPAKSLITGTAAGNLNVHNFDLKAETSEGALAAVGTASASNVNATFVMDTFNLGRVAGIKEIGKVSANVIADLSPFNPDSAIGKISADIAAASVLDHTYTGVKAELQLNKGDVQGAIASSDPSAHLNANLKGRFSKQSAAFDLETKIDTLDLYALKLSKDTLSLKGTINMSFNGKSLDQVEASGKTYGFELRKDHYTVRPDSLVFSLRSKENTFAADVSSPIADINTSGSGKLSTIGQDLASYIGTHFGDSRLPRDSADKAHDLTFLVKVKKPDELSFIVDTSLVISPFTVSGSYNGSKGELKASSELVYASLRGNTIDSLRINVNGSNESLSATVTAPHVVSKGMSFPNPRISLTAKNDSLNYTIAVTGNDSVRRLRIDGVIEKLEHGYAVSLRKNGFVLNNTSWEVSADNRIKIDSTGIDVRDFVIRNGDRSLALDKSPEGKLKLEAKDFELMDLSMIPDSNAFMTGGRISGNIRLPSSGELSALNGNVQIKDFNFRKDTLGDLDLALKQVDGSKLGIETTVSGHGNSIKIKGAYDFADKVTPFDFRLNLTQINFSTLTPLLSPVFEKAIGYAKADLTLRGNTVYPLLDGSLLITEVSLLPKYTHSWVKIKDQPVRVDQSSFLFTNFLMTDSLNDPALLNGYICPEGLPHIAFDLLLVTSNFLALNTREGDNEQYFGRAYVTSISSIKGDDINPYITIDAELERSSRLTLLVPEVKLRESDAGDVVRFVDHRADSVKNQIRKKRAQPSFAGVTLTSNVRVDETSEFKLLIDPVAGDSLSVKGNTTFSFSLDPGGKMSMAGVYEVTEGSYLLTLTKGLKRRFDILRGSKITWSGDPVNPELAVSAQYTVRAAPYDLVVNELTATTDNTALSYRQEMPFIVALKMNGPLSKPVVSFSVNLPSDQQGALEGTVYARLNQLNQNESELNTQVFSLLVLNRFFNHQEILNSGGPLFSSYARTGMSRLVSQRLNSFATTYAKFVELQVDVDFYETYTGNSIQNSTHMRVGVGRKFFAERLDVRTGGQFLLQGTSQLNNNDFPSLVTAEYKLTRDGRYRLSGFRKNTYEGVFEGQIIREGAGIVFIRDFNRFGEIFKRPEEHDILDAAPRPK